MPEVVEAGLRNTDTSPKLGPAGYRLMNRDLCIHITTDPTELHPPTGENLSPPLGGERIKLI